ncbi:hypothetical protein CANARDRAFT_193636 [[Candida] arabinofermentans NRRL YB-2248]|uniref:FAD-binding PCMH-type domain-containing protein n=1 Tax=[Candida] arabinofermentans NRRL YB-2248 TaxID=983967 RepID=A0A1E4T7P1_9ASCO|nr:hypothetical protein CANARDRAFT_193636 [[Candida] arabinofermentans NRRL YB-2248]
MAPPTADLPFDDITTIHPNLRHIPFTSTLQFFLNGELQTVRDPNPESRLIDWIRNDAGLTGTKEACSESGCNACSVTIAQVKKTIDADGNPKNDILYTAVNSCVTPLVLVEGKHVITVEGVGTAEDPHPVQERIAKFHGSQCGFCTPGFVMALYSLLRQKNGVVSVEEIDEALESNLCRCTGYMPIADAAYSFAHDSDNYNREKIRPFSDVAKCAMGDQCCQNKKQKTTLENEESSSPSATTEFPETEIDINAIFTPNGLPLKPYKPEEDLKFPIKLASYSKKPIFYGNEHKVWFRPITKQQLLELYYNYPSAKLVAGASEVQIEVKFKAADYKVSVFCNDIDELKTWEYIEGKGLMIGANLPLIELEALGDLYGEKLGKTGKGQVFIQIANQLKLFASKAVRNVATAAGNIVTASPIADLNPILVACGAIITTEKLNALGEVEVVELNMNDFFTGYRRTRLPPGSIVSKVFIPETKDNEFIHAYKQSKRKDDDISIVTACLRAQLTPDGKIENSTLVYGGMAPMTVQSKNTQEFIKDKSIFDEDFVEGACDNLSKDYPLSYNVPGGMASYRRSLTLSFFYKFWQYMLAHHKGDIARAQKLIDVDSLAQVTRHEKHGWRDLDNPNEGQLMGKNIVHVNALKQVAGEAQYTDDIPPFHKEVFGAQVFSAKAHAKIKSIDWSEALKIDTVVDYIDVNDLPTPESNYWGPLAFGKEPFLAEEEVFFAGQTIGVIFATDKERAYEATRAVKIEYEDLPAIVAVEDGVEQESFFPDKRETELGDWEKAFKESKHYIEGTARLSAQEHFYFEPQNSVVVPEEGGELKIYSSSQNPAETQEYGAQVTGVPSHKVVVRVKRLGGGFGGKETRAVQLSSLACIGAKKLKRPVRMQLNRSEDMLISGQRHPFLIKYRASLDEDLKFTGCDIVLYANAGWSMDLTRGVIDRAVLHATNSYYFPNARVCGIPVKTNTSSNTAYRSFGAQAGFYAAESIVLDIAERLNIDPEIIRQKNYYDPNADQIFHYKQKITEDISMRHIVQQNLEECKYEELKKQVAEFNSKSKWIKRGVAHVPAMFGVSFGVLFLNQGGALVHIYHDGSCLVSTGGVEIGQGLTTVMKMIAANELGVPVEQCFISETSTQCVPNTSATAASAGSDLNGMAVKYACEKLNERLKPIREKLGPDASWHKIISTAYLERISLSATGFYKTPDIGFIFGDPNPKPAFLYHTQGSAVSVVEVDTLTGDWTTLEAHIKMDVGKPLNQAIIYGQIEGAFIQGMGYFTMEQSLWFRHNSSLFTRGPGNYKIPGFRDIPQKFNVSMLKDTDFKHMKTIHSSKGVGEPPFFLGCSVQYAIRDAIGYARRQNGIPEGSQGLKMQTPLTTERIRNDCGDSIMKKAIVIPKDESEKDFFIEA